MGGGGRGGTLAAAGALAVGIALGGGADAASCCLFNWATSAGGGCLKLSAAAGVVGLGEILLAFEGKVEEAFGSATGAAGSDAAASLAPTESSSCCACALSIFLSCFTGHWAICLMKTTLDKKKSNPPSSALVRSRPSPTVATHRSHSRAWHPLAQKKLQSNYHLLMQHRTNLTTAA